MVSLLAFIFRKRKAFKAKRRGALEAANNAGSPVPTVSTANSGDNMHSDSEDLDGSFETAVPYFSESPVPLTPDGLRPRQSLAALRYQLDIPSLVGPTENVPYRHPTQSPQISDSSFYSRTASGTMVAESPELSVGRARTAVGALVAMNHRMPTKQTTINEEDSPDRLGVLPPRNWLQPPIEKLDEDDDVSDMPYHRLDDSHDVLTPSRGRGSYVHGSPMSTVDASSIHASPATWRQYEEYKDERYEKTQNQERAELNLSFSSQLGLVEDGALERQPYNFEPIHVKENETDFDKNIEGHKFIVNAADQPTNVSAMSHSTSGPSEEWTWAINDDRMGSLQESSSSTLKFSVFGGQEALDSVLLQQKAMNQRRHKERLVIALARRLQDDNRILADVDALHDDDSGVNRVFLKTNLDREGLLVGYNNENRVRLLHTISNLIHQMDIAQPEEFFMSPTNIPDIAETHNDLREALRFLDSIVRTSIPEKERGELQGAAKGLQEQPMSDIRGTQTRWLAKNWLRSTMGFESIPESPDPVRGGDTSLFSLPSDSCDTPHMSNVSVATTITSKNSPEERSPPPHQVTKLLRALEIAATLFQKLTLASDQLLKVDHSSSKVSIQAVDEIKRNHLQLISLPLPELTSLVNAFHQEERQLSRVVSIDENEQRERTDAPVPTRKVLGQLNENTFSGQRIAADMAFSKCKKTDSANGIESRDFFSPISDDMKSDTRTEDEIDSHYEALDERESASCSREGDECEREGSDETCSGDEELYGQRDTPRSAAFPVMAVRAEVITRTPMAKV